MSRRERRLIRRLRRREESAFRELLAEYGDQVFGVCFRMLGQREEAEDVAQEVFIAVFKSVDSFREESKLSTWLYRVASNHCKNRIKYLARRQERQRVGLEEVDRAGADSLAPPVAAPDRELSGKELEVVVTKAVQSLDEDHRLLVVLRDMEGLSYAEIATIAGLPEGTVKSKLSRARALLRARVAKEREE